MNLTDGITVTPKLPASLSGNAEVSWWTVQPAEGFTGYATALFDRRRPQSTISTAKDVWPKRRKSDLPE